MDDNLGTASIAALVEKYYNPECLIIDTNLDELGQHLKFVADLYESHYRGNSNYNQTSTEESRGYAFDGSLN